MEFRRLKAGGPVHGLCCFPHGIQVNNSETIHHILELHNQVNGWCEPGLLQLGVEGYR